MKIKTETYDAKKGKTYRYAHVKRDGHFLNVVRSSGDGKCFAWTSRPLNIIEQLPPAIYDAIKQLPLGTSLLGELWIPGKRASDVKTALAESSAELQYHVFAILGYPNFDPARLSALALPAVQRLVNEMGLHFIPYLEQPFNPATLLQSLKPDWEGFVLKNSNLQDWCKLKPRNTVDLIITGFVDGEGKYANQIGSLVCSTAEGYEVANVSGMTDTQRRYMSEHSETIIGQVCEVEYQNVGNQGRLRHPSFVRMRDDKAAADCTTDQDATLESFWKTGRLF